MQGVGYRNYVERKAQQLGLAGYVMNLKDGRVRVRVEGLREMIDGLVRDLEKGPPLARVEQVSVTWRPPRAASTRSGSATRSSTRESARLARAAALCHRPDVHRAPRGARRRSPAPPSSRPPESGAALRAPATAANRGARRPATAPAKRAKDVDENNRRNPTAPAKTDPKPAAKPRDSSPRHRDPRRDRRARRRGARRDAVGEPAASPRSARPLARRRDRRVQLPSQGETWSRPTGTREPGPRLATPPASGGRRWASACDARMERARRQGPTPPPETRGPTACSWPSVGPAARPHRALPRRCPSSGAPVDPAVAGRWAGGLAVRAAPERLARRHRHQGRRRDADRRRRGGHRDLQRLGARVRARGQDRARQRVRHPLRAQPAEPGRGRRSRGGGRGHRHRGPERDAAARTTFTSRSAATAWPTTRCTSCPTRDDDARAAREARRRHGRRRGRG